ncbi:hypothetical protein [Silvibacterium sp.]|uniref:hypothetical protein n=1 Tax=Silvibacterium sp. TaxID=1964179 RepID=UPI0039E60023
MASGTDWTHSAESLNAHSPRALTYDLRPLSTGEILDRTFQIYRSRFSLFAGLSAMPAAVGVITQAIRLWYDAHQSVHAHQGADLYRVQIVSGGLTLLAGILSLVLYGIVLAASTWSVSALYLGASASLGEALQRSRVHWFRYVAIVLRQIFSAFWLFLALVCTGLVLQIMGRRSPDTLSTMNAIAGLLYILAFFSMIYCCWAYIRVSLAVPASVVESLRVGAALRRSRKLLADRKVRVFLVLLFLAVLYGVVGAIQTPLAIFALRSRGGQAFLINAITLTLSFITSTLIGPVGAIALCLLYIDERVRREGFDIEWMMSRIAPQAADTLPPSSQENIQPL